VESHQGRTSERSHDRELRGYLILVLPTAQSVSAQRFSNWSEMRQVARSCKKIYKGHGRISLVDDMEGLRGTVVNFLVYHRSTRATLSKVMILRQSSNKRWDVHMQTDIRREAEKHDTGGEMLEASGRRTNMK